FGFVEKKANLAKLFTQKEALMLDGYAGKKMLEYEDVEILGKAKKSQLFQTVQDSASIRVSNHLEDHFHLGNKKALLYNMRNYYECLKDDVFNYLPLTFHIRT